MIASVPELCIRFTYIAPHNMLLYRRNMLNIDANNDKHRSDNDFVMEYPMVSFTLLRKFVFPLRSSSQFH